MRSSAKRLWAWAVPLVFLGVLFLLPVGRLAALGLEGDWVSSLAGARVAEAIANTLGLSLLATGLSVALGVPAAYLLYRRDFRGVALLRALSAVPFVLPVIVVAVGFGALQKWHTFYSKFGMDWLTEGLVENRYYWITVALIFMNLSIVVRATGSQWASLDPAIEESAALDGAGRLRTAVSVALPQLRGTVASAAVLVFLYCASSYGIVLVLGGGNVRTLETELSKSVNAFLELDRAAALGLLQLSITAIAFFAATWTSKGSIGLNSSEPESRQQKLDRRDRPLVWLVGVFAVPLVLLPLIAVVAQSFTRAGSFSFENYSDLLGFGARDLLDITVFEAMANSLRNTIVATLIAVTLGTLVAVLLTRIRRLALRAALDTLFLLPMGVSMVVLGFGYLITFDTEPLALRSSWMVVPLAQSIAAFPLVIRLVYPALLALGPETREAASLDGANSRQVWWRIELPQVSASVKTAIGYAAVASLGEFGAASFLAYGDQATLPTVLYRLIARPGAQNFGMAMAVATLLIVATFAVLLLVSASRRRR